VDPQAVQRGDPPQRRGRFQNAFRYLQEVAARPGAAFPSAEGPSGVLPGSNQAPNPSRVPRAACCFAPTLPIIEAAPIPTVAVKS